MPDDQMIVVEGFGILPELVAPYLSHPNQAIWLIPAESFKQASMDRRGKPSFASKMSNPPLAKSNLFARDMLLVEHLRKTVTESGYSLHVTDGSLSLEQTVDLIDAHFQFYIGANGR